MDGCLYDGICRSGLSLLGLLLFEPQEWTGAEYLDWAAMDGYAFVQMRDV
jgi:hypothetical protein